MKKILLWAALLLTAFSCPAETRQALTLHMESGANVVYYLDTQPSIAFKGQTMVVTVDGEATDIPMADVTSWEIGMAEYSGMPSLTEEMGVSIAINGNTLTILNPQSSHIAIYNLSGQMVGSGSQREASFTLPQGIYVVTIANNRYKIAIR